jgi:hypothetical protein
MRDRKMIILIGMAILSIGAAAAEGPALAGAFDDFSVGFSIGQGAEDFAIGARALSPYLFRDMLAFSASADLLWRSGALDANPGSETWTPYWAFKLGVVAGPPPLPNGIRLYGFGGALLALPDASFDPDPYAVGGYGGFGFEFLIGGSERFGSSYFIELGSDGIGLRAEGMAGDPLYLNGFAVSAGFRMYL